MPTGYVVFTGSNGVTPSNGLPLSGDQVGVLNALGVITVGQPVTYDTAVDLGAGTIGTLGLGALTIQGRYALGTNGVVYFTPNTALQLGLGVIPEVATYNGPSIVYDNTPGALLGGTAGADVIFGGAYNPLTQNGLDDVEGNTVSDSITGGGGNDIIYGLGGNDTLRGEAGSDTLYGDLGNDVLFGGAENDALFGGDGADSLTGDAGIDTLYGGAGIDVLNGGADGDSLFGGADGDVLNGGAGDDTLFGDAGNDSLYGNENNDILFGGEGTDSLYGGNGNDTLFGGEGADVLDGGGDIDTVSYEGATGAVNANLGGTGSLGDAAGDTYIDVENLIGTNFNDTLTGNGVANNLSGGLGNDTLQGGAGADTLAGGDGSDTADYSDSTAGVSVNLGTGATAGGTAEGDVLSSIENVTGSAGADTLTGNALANALTGGAGDDTLQGGAGADTLAGGIGTDTASYADSDVGVTVDLDTNVNTGGTAQGDILTGIENIVGSGSSDNLSGNGENNALFGGGGNDTLSGGAGSDTLSGGSGSNTLDGGAGSDTAAYTDSATGVNVNLTTGIGSHGAGQTDTLNSIENVTGSALNDTLTGNAAVNVLDGGAGDDTLIGGAGNDTLIGGDGTDTADYTGADAGVTVDLGAGTAADGFGDADTLINIENATGSANADSLTGSDAANVLDGGAGDDTLQGGLGADTLTGGAGIDTADYTDSDVGVTVNLETGAGTGGTAEGDSLSGIENITGGASDDILTGDGGSNSLIGGDGNDQLFGGNGDDTLSGGTGADVLNGGAGFDYADYADSASGVNINLGTGVNTGGSAEGDVLANIEGLTGSDFNDTLVGGAGANTFFGGGGDDQITLGRGDTVDGGTGNDTFIIDDAVDNGDGPEGPITIIGGGSDTADGGNGDVIDLSDVRGWTNTDNGDGSGQIVLSDGTVINYEGISQVLCFTPGAMIRTLGGLRAIETLKAGDMVLTRDGGLQPIRWIGTSIVSGMGDFAPIRLRQGAVPELTGDLLVSPQHRMLVEGYRAELLFGEREVLAAAKHMVDGKFVTVEEMEQVTYIHMLFDQHEVVYANGAATESYHPASYGLGGVCEEARAELFAIFPELRSMPESYGKTARRVLKSFEAAALSW